MKNGNYYLGLDIGTDSVGYAVADEQYNLLKFHGEPAWGVTVFDNVTPNEKRRSFRTARRRLDRRQQRVALIQELFAEEIAKVDERFFIRLRESRLFREDTPDSFTLFQDAAYTDREYHREYPTIHHLICELMESKEPHDVRLVYLAVSWLAAHRGHFLSHISMDNLARITDFNTAYQQFENYFTANGFALPWKSDRAQGIGEILKEKQNVTQKNKRLQQLLFDGKKPEQPPEFPFSVAAMLKLLAGGTCKLKDLFGKEEYEEYGSVALNLDDDKMGVIMANIGEDYDLIAAMRALYDWAVLVDILGSYDTVSAAKKAVYEQHHQDLKTLKYMIWKYKPEKYAEVFRKKNQTNYVAYSYHTNDGDTSQIEKKAKTEDFSKYILGIVKTIVPDEEDMSAYQDMTQRLEWNTFLPKQKNTDNRVIPYQLYLYELQKILNQAAGYLPFLHTADADGITVQQKILSVFLFRVPYFVGPLNRHSDNSWFERKAGKEADRIYPWNFENVVDLDASEEAFIQKLTNHCTYLPDEYVLPKDSLCYHKFTVLNELNNIRIGGEKISVELKQQIYRELFLQKKKVTRRELTAYLLQNGCLQKGEESALTGIDQQIQSNLAARNALMAFNARVSLTCLYVLARGLPRPLCGLVWIARPQEGGHGAPVVWLGTEQNVSVCLMLHRWPPIGLSLSKSMEFHCRTIGTRKGRETCPAGFRPAVP